MNRDGAENWKKEGLQGNVELNLAEVGPDVGLSPLNLS